MFFFFSPTFSGANGAMEIIMTGEVKSVNISEARGTQKNPKETISLVVGYGIEGDAHGGDWHRQVSLLSNNKIEEFNAKGAGATYGEFAENIVVHGIDFRSLPIGTTLQCNNSILEITQIGKTCHTHCQIYQKMNDCIMPREGVFAKVIQNGNISVGDTMHILYLAQETTHA